MVKNEPLPKKDFCARKTDRTSRQTENRKGWVGWWVGADQRKKYKCETNSQNWATPIISSCRIPFFNGKSVFQSMAVGGRGGRGAVFSWCSGWLLLQLFKWFPSLEMVIIGLIYVDFGRCPCLCSIILSLHPSAHDERVGLLWLDQCRNITHWKYW